MARKTNVGRNIVTFEAEDAVVMDILDRAEKRGRGEKSKLINEAIRQNGDKTSLSILKREIEIAKAKYRNAQQTIRARERQKKQK